MKIIKKYYDKKILWPFIEQCDLLNYNYRQTETEKMQMKLKKMKRIKILNSTI